MRPLIKDMASLAYHDIRRRKKTTPFIILVTFIISLGLARFTVLTFPDAALIVREYHIHHFYFGILLVAIAAWTALVSNRARLHTLAAVFLGTGLGLITDELGLLLTCNSEGLNCDYFARGSFDAAVFLGLLFLAAIYFPPFWLKVKDKLTRTK